MTTSVPVSTNIKSLLDSSVDYEETQNIATEDKGYTTNIYRVTMDIDNTLQEMNITLGKAFYPNNSKTITAYNIYLPLNNKKHVSKIGVYEVLTTYLNEFEECKLDNNNPDCVIKIMESKEPLLFSYANTRDKIEIIKNKVTANADYTNEFNTQTIKKLGIFNIISPPTMELLSNINKKLINNYIPDSNNEYDIVKTTDDGNCFFDAIVKAYQTVGLNTTIELLKGKLADKMIECGLFEKYKDDYENANPKDTTNLDYLDVNFMERVDNNSDFKNAIISKKYWADEYSIPMLEHILNVKFIIFQESICHLFWYI